MRLVMVCVRDAKAEVFMRPWFANTAGMAIRAFTDEVNRDDKDNQLFKHPGDFALYEVGLFDDNEGKVYSYDVPKILISADQIVYREEALGLRKNGITVV